MLAKKKSKALVRICLGLSFFLLIGTSHSADVSAPKAGENNDNENNDKLLLEKVVDNVYAIVGPLGNRTPANLGNNATFGLVVTAEGVVLIDPGGTYKGAKRIHEVIKTVTDKPVKFVVNTGGQDHRWLGNDYFQRQGAKVIASKSAVTDQKNRLKDIYFMLSNTAGDKAMEGTVDAYADIQFDKQYAFSVGGVEIEVVHPGAAHSPGDAYVWLPAQKVVFSGDIIYTERLLSLMAFSNSKAWVQAFEAVAALQPEHVVPGHGGPTSLQAAKQSTYDYLTMLRNKVGDFMDQGGVIQDVSKIDQSRFEHLENFESLKGRNVQQVYQEMEWE
jgi:glyoxylase-like metal-dependent hydrolase (beta-lactamase superfamily II)